MSSAIPFKQIAVIGAGTMGSGIAGQIANAGLMFCCLICPLMIMQMPSPRVRYNACSIRPAGIDA